MQKILIAGAEGALGSELLKLLHKKNMPVRALIHRHKSMEKVKKYTDDVFVAGISDTNKIKDLCKGIDIVVSCLGKSVSLFKPRMSTYEEVDFEGNCHILDEALRSGVRRFVYTSIKGSDTAYHLKIANVHKKIMAGLIQEKTGARIVHIPAGLMKAGIAPLQLFKSSLAQNINYFKYVSTHDMPASAYGKITFKDYLNSLDLNQLA